MNDPRDAADTIMLHAGYRSIAAGIQSVEAVLGSSHTLTPKQIKTADKAVTVAKVGLKLLKYALQSRGVKRPKDAR